jgi:uncharacterized phage-associated protein
MPIQFNFNKQKSIESILWLIQKGESNMYNILKMLFEAEKYHLNKYGRPITGDDYYAMDFGIVPTETYRMIRDDLSRGSFCKEENNMIKLREANLSHLSKSDVKALTHGYDKYAGLDFNQVMIKNHEESAWKKYYIQGTSNRIPFEILIEEEWLKDDLATTAHNMVL